MPIYELKNNKHSVSAKVEIKYQDDEKRLSKKSMCVHFGFGDVVIGSGTSRNSFADELTFRDAGEPHEIGTKEGDDYDRRPCFPPVRFVFDRAESIDAVIRELQDLKSGFPPSE